jgi:hypothetical protein
MPPGAAAQYKVNLSWEETAISVILPLIWPGPINRHVKGLVSPSAVSVAAGAVPAAVNIKTDEIIIKKITPHFFMEPSPVF